MSTVASLPNSELPTPFLSVWELCQAEKDPFRKIHRLIDSMETFVKIHTVLSMNFYFHESKSEISNELKAMLSLGLKTPSLGIWWWFTKEFAKETIKIQKGKDTFGFGRFILSTKQCKKCQAINVVEKSKEKGYKEAEAKVCINCEASLDNLKTEKSLLWQAMEGEQNFIQFRNSYTHGSTPNDEKCLSDLKKYEPKLVSLLEGAIHFKEYRISVEESSPTNTKECYVVDSSSLRISLFPLLVYDSKGKHFFFYNDYRGSAVSLLNYEKSLHEKNKELNDPFLKKFPLEEWGKSDAVENFKERIEYLTELFKGRIKELETIGNFLMKQSRGIFFFWGPPGIGKSALLARASQVFSWSEEMRLAHGIKTEGSLTKLHIIEYFIRRDMGTNDVTKLFDNLNIRLEAMFKTGIPTGGDLKEQKGYFQQRLKKISECLIEGEKLLLIIDGLDEGSDSEGLLESLPRTIPEKIILLYASRDHIQVRNIVFENLEREINESLALGGFSEEDTRSFLYDYVDKYALQSEFVEAVTKKSEGNPLYIKLLCQGLQAKDYRLNDISHLPSGMEELYDVLLKRISQTPGASDFLRMLTASKDYFSQEMVSSLMGLSLDDVEGKIFPACMEVLIENPLTSGYDDYQLFHESLREYLRKKYPAEMNKWRKNLIEWCRNYKSLDGHSQSYALRYIISHLYDEYIIQIKENTKDSISHADSLLQEMRILLRDENFRFSVFRSAGNAFPLQFGLKKLIQILIRKELHKDVKSSFQHQDEIIEFTMMLHREPEVLFEKQKNEIIRLGKIGDWENISQIATMGSSPQEKVLLALRGVIENKQGKPSNSQAFQDSMKKWLDESSDPILEKLVMKLTN